jgi:hypothetical protein
MPTSSAITFWQFPPGPHSTMSITAHNSGLEPSKSPATAGSENMQMIVTIIPNIFT